MWTLPEIEKLHRLVCEQGKSYAEAGHLLKKSQTSIRKKVRRTNWENFLKDKRSVEIDKRLWTKEELILLHALRVDANKSYIEIADKLGRTPISCERKFQDVKWEEINPSKIGDVLKEKDEKETSLTKDSVKSIANHMVNLSRHNIDVLEEMQKSYFLNKSGLKESDLPLSYKDIKEEAKNILNKMGLCFNSHLHFKEGTYIIVGDSHGKHTKRHTIDLIKNLNKHLKATNIIHIGHFLDDDNESSYCWEDFSNLIVLAKREELQKLSSDNHKYNIIRNEIRLGDLSICNQDEIGDYTNTFIGNLKKQVFPESTVINSHRHEMDTRTTSDGVSQLFSPGCLCEPHIVRTIKQINFEDGDVQIKLAYWDGFSKYRKMRHRNVFWEQGLFVVHVDSKNSFDVIGCKILKTSKGYTTSYFNKIITENGVYDPSEKIFFNGDAHVLSHDENVLDLQDQFCKDYKPSIAVNIGDISDGRPLNHHQMSRNGWAINKSLLQETAGVHYVLKKMREWSKKFYLIYGNHERFVKDFVEKLPQFSDLLDFEFIMDLKSIDVDLIKHKEILRLNGLKFIHGDLKLYGARGQSKLEKVSQSLGQNTILGDIHYPSMRFGCYSVGLSGKIDQEYNETSATRWLHGFGFCNVFEDKCFVSLISIRNNQFSINKKKYTPKHPSQWKIPIFEASISYNFK